MKFLAKALIVIFVMVGLAWFVVRDPGYVLIHYDRKVWEMTLAVFLLVLLLFIALAVVLFKFSVRVFRVPNRVGQWRQQRRTGKASKSLSSGLVELAEGNWQQAEKKLLRYTGASETPLLNYLAASRAAQGQGAWERRDAYLKQAIEAMPDAGIAVGLTQAEMQLHHGQLEQALASARHLKQLAPKHHYVTRLLVDIYRQLGDWRQFIDHLQQLKKTDLYTREEWNAELRSGYLHLLQDRLEASSLEKLQKIWESMPKWLQTEEQLVTAYVARLIRLGEGRYAEPVVRAALEHGWRERLVELYGVIPGDAGEQLQTALRWQRSHPRDAYLLLTLGRLHMRQKIWGKARQYLEESVDLGASSSALVLLAALQQQLGDPAQALESIRLGFGEFIKEKETLDPVDQCLITELTTQESWGKLRPERLPPGDS